MSKKNSGQGAGYVGKGVRGSPEEGKTRERMWLRPPVQTHSVGGAGGHAIREIPHGAGLREGLLFSVSPSSNAEEEFLRR